MEFNEDVVKEQAERYDSFYLYDERQIVARAQELKEHFSNILFLYSVKCNSNTNVLRSVFSQGFGGDVASAGEVRKALAVGMKKENIYYSAPGKSIEDIQETIKSCILIADSINEIKRIQIVADWRNEVRDTVRRSCGDLQSVSARPFSHLYQAERSHAGERMASGTAVLRAV